MEHLIIPEDYFSPLSLYDTQVAIKTVKDFFQSVLAKQLNLLRVSSPLCVDPASGMNDNLNGIERPVSFGIKEQNERQAEIVQSLAKWKRYALKEYGFAHGEGLYTDMNAIRRDEITDNIHSIYVDQWDWEKVIRREDRNLSFLKKTVRRIYEAIKVTENKLFIEFPQVTPSLPEDIFFIHAEELLRMYPDLTPKERENEIVRQHRAVFLIGIGGELSDGTVHDGRAADYDDWSTPNEDGFNGLNGDILLWNDVLQSSFEVSSMGIRVDCEAMRRQLAIRGQEDKAELYFHKRLLAGELPYTIGGGVGQSRLCMFLLKKAHIGEIQSSIWSEEDRRKCAEAGIVLA